LSKIAKPLTELRKNTPFGWNQTAEDAFVTLKYLLTNEQLLQYPDFTRPLVLTTDASNQEMGAILSQGSIGQDLSIFYASRTLTNSEKN